MTRNDLTMSQPAESPSTSVDSLADACVAAAMQRIRQAAFCAAFAECGSIQRAADAVGVHRSVHYLWLKEHPEYAEAFGEARVQAADLLVEEARRRAVEGVQRYRFNSKTGAPLIHPVTGEPYTELEYSDSLLSLLLKAHKREEFGDKVDATVKTDGGGVLLIPSSVDPRDWARVAAAQQSAHGGGGVEGGPDAPSAV
jgi:transposase